MNCFHFILWYKIMPSYSYYQYLFKFFLYKTACWQIFRFQKIRSPVKNKQHLHSRHLESYLVYVPERSFMHVTVCCWFLISFVMGGSSVVMLLYRTEGLGEHCGKVTLLHCSPHSLSNGKIYGPSLSKKNPNFCFQ